MGRNCPSLLARDVNELVLTLDFRLTCIHFVLDLVIRSGVRQGKRTRLHLTEADQNLGQEGAAADSCEASCSGYFSHGYDENLTEPA